MNNFASALQATASLGDLCRVKEVHTDMIKSRHLVDIFVGSVLVDMCGKCGSIEDAQKVFDNMLTQDVVSWTAIVVGYAMYGYVKESTTRWDCVTFVDVLAAYCQTGLVDDGWQYLHLMYEIFYIVPIMEHYCCLVKLLRCAGLLDQAQEFVKKMPTKPDTSIWRSSMVPLEIIKA